MKYHSPLHGSKKSKFLYLFFPLMYSKMAFAWSIAGPLCGLANIFRGPAGLAIATIAFFALGAALMWGEEIAGISKKMVNIIVAVSIIFGGPSIVTWVASKMDAVPASCQGYN